MRTVVILCALTLALSGCKRFREASSTSGETTGTIAPAAPSPDQTGSDAMTQTVDIEDSRSENDGGVLTNPNPGVKTGATATTGTTGTTGTMTGTVAPPPTTTTR